MLVRGVIHYQVGHDAQTLGVRGFHENPEVFDCADVAVDTDEIRDVVPVIESRRGIHRQQPDAIDTEVSNVIEPLGHAGQIANAIPGGVEKRLDRSLVEHRVLEPQFVAVQHADLHHPTSPRRRGHETSCQPAG